MPAKNTYLSAKDGFVCPSSAKNGGGGAEASVTWPSAASGAGTTGLVVHRQEEQHSLRLGGVHQRLEGLGRGVRPGPRVGAEVLAPLIRVRVEAVLAGLRAVVRGLLRPRLGHLRRALLAAHGITERRRSLDPHLSVELGEVSRAPRPHLESAGVMVLCLVDLCLDVLERLGGVDTVAQGDEASEEHVERESRSTEVHLVSDAPHSGVIPADALPRFSLAGVGIPARDDALADDTDRGGQNPAPGQKFTLISHSRGMQKQLLSGSSVPGKGEKGKVFGRWDG